MNAENFPSFLQDPSKLYQIPYQELKSLVVQYPYCQPLRLLLLQKSQMDRHPEYERNLHQAATYMPDRTLLYLLIREFQSLETRTDLLDLEEERLELKALSEIFAERESREKQPESAPVAPAPPEEKELYALLDLFREEKPEEEELEDEPEVPSAEKTPEEQPQAEPEPQPPVAAPPAPVPRQEKPAPRAPLPKSAFASWKAAAHRQPVWDEPKAPLPEKTQEQPVLARELARRSVEEKEDIATETLAGLLALQGHTQKAIQMYEKLCLIFPEKSSFFAQKIDKLKRK